MEKQNLLGIILGAGLIFSGCSMTNDSQIQNKTTGGAQAPAADQKRGDTTKVGSISQSGGNYLLRVSGQQPEIIESYQVELSEHVGQTVEVTGQYSGDTLFVGTIKKL